MIKKPDFPNPVLFIHRYVINTSIQVIFSFLRSDVVNKLNINTLLIEFNFNAKVTRGANAAILFCFSFKSRTCHIDDGKDYLCVTLCLFDFSNSVVSIQ